MESISGYGILMLLIYFCPTLLAAIRQHHNEGAIFILNLILGWTVIGWIVALVWSATAVNRSD